MVMNFTWVAPAVIRRINIEKHILPVATEELRNTIIKSKLNCLFTLRVHCHA